MTRNLWTDNASALAEAYVRSAGTIRFELVTRSLLMHLPREPQRVVDVGGGFGRQAIMLARAGHSVVVIDFDQNMLAIAQEALSHESQAVYSRVDLVLGDGQAARSLVDGHFDLACCHSVLMYQDDPVPMLYSLVDLVRHGGLISVFCVNKDALAMRTGLQGRWREAVAILKTGKQADSQYVPTREHSREEVTTIIEAAGARIRGWHGVGVFTDHLTEKVAVDDIEDVYSAEWLAGNQDPYRQVARCYHIVAERTG